MITKLLKCAIGKYWFKYKFAKRVIDKSNLASRHPSGNLRQTRLTLIEDEWRNSKTWHRSLNVSAGDVLQDSILQGFLIQISDDNWGESLSKENVDWETPSILKWVNRQPVHERYWIFIHRCEKVLRGEYLSLKTSSEMFVSDWKI